MRLQNRLKSEAALSAFASFNEGEPDKFDLNKALADDDAKAAIMDWAERNIAAGLKTKNNDLLTKLTKYKIADKDDKGNTVEVYIDPEKAKQALDFVATEGKDFDTKITKAVEEANNRAGQRITGLERENETVKSALAQEISKRHNQQIGFELRDQLRNAGIKDGKLPLHERYLAESIYVDIDDKGRESLVIKDKNGDLRYGKKGLMTVEEYVLEYRDKDDISDDFGTTTKGGSGGGPGKQVPRGRTSNGAIDQSLPPQERMRQFRAQEASRKR